MRPKRQPILRLMEKWVAYVLISVVAAVIIILLVFSGLLPKALNAASGQLKAPAHFLPS